MKLFKYWSYFLLISSLSFIGAATLSFSSVVIPQQLSVKFIVDGFTFGSDIKDYWQNILLFIPWGFGCAAIASFRFKQIWLILIIALFCSTFLSTAIEFTQLFLPARVSNLTDIICNSLGGCLGGVLYCDRQIILDFILTIIEGKFRQLSYRSIVSAILGYCWLITLAISVLSYGINLSNWDNNYYLAIGNEVTGNRPWNGYLRSLYISDRSLNDSDIVRALKDSEGFLKDSSNLVMMLDVSKGRLLSNLAWQYRSENQKINRNIVTKDNAIILDDRQWLNSDSPATYLAKKIKETAEFTISLSVATNDFNIVGPARIFSLSQNIYVQNLIVAQEKNNLHFRLRNSITGRNASYPELILPNVFNDRNFHQILITLSGNRLNFYIDRYQNNYSYSFSPDNSFLVFVPWNNRERQINLKNFSPLKYQIIFYAIIIVPILFFTTILGLKLTSHN